MAPPQASGWKVSQLAGKPNSVPTFAMGTLSGAHRYGGRRSFL